MRHKAFFYIIIGGVLAGACSIDENGTANESPAPGGLTCGPGTVQVGNQCLPGDSGTDGTGGIIAVGGGGSGGSSASDGSWPSGAGGLPDSGGAGLSGAGGGGSGTAGSPGSGGEAGSTKDGSAGAGGSGGAGGSAGSGGTTATGGVGATGGAGGTGATGGSSGSGGSGGSGGTSGVGGFTGPDGCAAPDKIGANVTVSVKIIFQPSDVPLTVYNDLDGQGWKPQTFFFTNITVKDLATPGLHRVQGELNNNDWLVRGCPDLSLAVAPAAITVIFGESCPLQRSMPAALSAGQTLMPPYSIAYGRLAGEQGPSLLICTNEQGCDLTQAPAPCG